MKIENSVILITGAGSGIGEGMASYFCSLGGIVYFCDVDEERGKLVESNNKNKGGKIKFIKCDVSNEEEVKSMVDEVYNKEGRLDAVVNNAGISGIIDTDVDIDTSIENFKRIYKINLLGTFLVSKYAAEKMIKNSHKSRDCNGVIINISSNLGISGTKGLTSYSMSKAGVIGMTLPMARDLGKFKIRVNAICPGYVPTHLSSNLGDKSIKALKASIPTKEFGTPKQIAEACEAAIVNDFMNGWIVKVDGGLVANF